MDLDTVKEKAKLLGLDYKSVNYSTRANKRFSIKNNGKMIHFGQKGAKTFIDHHDEKIRENFRKRHSKIIKKDGSFAYLDKNSPSFYSYNLLW